MKKTLHVQMANHGSRHEHQVSDLWLWPPGLVECTREEWEWFIASYPRKLTIYRPDNGYGASVEYHRDMEPGVLPNIGVDAVAKRVLGDGPYAIKR